MEHVLGELGLPWLEAFPAPKAQKLPKYEAVSSFWGGEKLIPWRGNGYTEVAATSVEVHFGAKHALRGDYVAGSPGKVSLDGKRPWLGTEFPWKMVGEVAHLRIVYVIRYGEAKAFWKEASFAVRSGGEHPGIIPLVREMLGVRVILGSGDWEPSPGWVDKARLFAPGAFTKLRQQRRRRHPQPQHQHRRPRR